MEKHGGYCDIRGDLNIIRDMRLYTRYLKHVKSITGIINVHLLV